MLLNKIKNALTKTSSKIVNELKKIFVNKKIDKDSLSRLQNILIASDLGHTTSQFIIKELAKKTIKDSDAPENINEYLSEIIINSIQQYEKPLSISDDSLNIILLFGVNGNGKTTSIAKLAAKYMKENKKVAVAACDTFRAAAVDQLKIWCNKIGVFFYSGEATSDPASIAYRAVKEAIKDKYDILFIDTAGRLHNNVNLMNEFSKINKVIDKVTENKIPRHNLLVLDATTGQNTLHQTKEFMNIISIDGLIVNKTDVSHRAASLINVVYQCHLPVYFIGTGEKIEDLVEFDTENFVHSMLAKK